MIDLLSGFVAELRAAGLPVSLTETVDAAMAVRQIPLEDREAFKYALGAALVKSHAHWQAFETVFEVYFALRGPEHAIGEASSEAGGGEEGELDAMAALAALAGDGRPGGGGAAEALGPDELAEMLYRALLRADQAAV
ncbi:MAG: vWA domain-containing protein, partial [Acidimicrobiales bacterium]